MIDALKLVLLFLVVYVVGKAQYDFLSWGVNKILDKLMPATKLPPDAEARKAAVRALRLRRTCTCENGCKAPDCDRI